MNISEKIMKLRKEKGLSQEAFAEELGVSRQSVSKWESSGALPDIDKIIAMSKLFGVSTDYLLKDETSETNSATPEDVLNTDALVSEEENIEYILAPQEPKKKKKLLKKVIALILVLCIAAAAIGIPAYYGGIKEFWWELNGGKIEYPYVLVHGLGGWGEGDGINETVQYWGATSCDLKNILETKGYEVHTPSVGPVSSAWDRACELYAQLTGTTVDYGEAHSKEHNHERYGRTYSTPLIENWGEKINGGQRVKINLVGHSFGGATVRLLASLLEYGSEAEVQATGRESSPLFEGGKGNFVHSVTALCAPHNGSSLTEVLNSLGGTIGITDTTDLLVSLCFGVAGIASPVDGIYDFKLEHFGIGNDSAEKAVDALTAAGNDHAAYDLTPDGAAKLNETIKTVEDVYYFSYSYSTTREGTLLKGHVPNTTTLPILYPFALAMGSYTGTTDGGISIDKSWQENDGLVSVVSARYPFNEPYIEYTEFPTEDIKITQGTWHVMPTKSGDHGNVIGLNAETEPTVEFYTTHFSMVDALER